MVAAGKTEQEIDLAIMYIDDEHREQIWDHVFELWAERERDLGPPNRRKRPRLIPDSERAAANAIRGLRKDLIRLTWKNVATRMQDEVHGCEYLSERTLRRWRDEDGWPDLSDPRWETR